MLVDGPHFQATDEGELVFLLSDGDSSRRPTEHDILEPEEEDGTLRQNYYVRVPLDHADSHRWREEIAKYLAPLVLGTSMGTLPWTLADFPQGYVLLLHKAPRRAEPSKARRDFYLYGATDVPSFASPLEFVKHAEWLMRGAHRTPDSRRSPRCTCKYCSYPAAADNVVGRGGARTLKNLKAHRDKKQSALSRGLRRVRARVLARIKNGDDGEDEDAEVDAEVDEVMEDGTGEGEGGVGEGEKEEKGERDVDGEQEPVNGVGVKADVVVNAEPAPAPANGVPATDQVATTEG